MGSLGGCGKEVYSENLENNSLIRTSFVGSL